MKKLLEKIIVKALVAAALIMSFSGCSNDSSDNNVIQIPQKQNKYDYSKTPFHFKGGDTTFSITETKNEPVRALINVDNTFTEICAKDNLNTFVQINFGFNEKYVITDLINAEEYPMAIEGIYDTPWGINGKGTDFTWGDQKITVIVTDTTDDPYDNGWQTEVLITLENWMGGDIDIENMFSDPKRVEIRFGAGNPPHRQKEGQTGWTKDSRSLRKRMTAYKDGKKYTGSNIILYFEYEDGSEGLVEQIKLKEDRGQTKYDDFTGMKKISFALKESDSFGWMKASDSAHVDFNDTSKIKHYNKTQYDKIDDDKNVFLENEE